MIALSAFVDKRFRHGHRLTTKSHEHTEVQLVALVAVEDGHSISALGALMRVHAFLPFLLVLGPLRSCAGGQDVGM